MPEINLADDSPQPVKRGRGRPRKNPEPIPENPEPRISLAEPEPEVAPVPVAPPPAKDAVDITLAAAAQQVIHLSSWLKGVQPASLYDAIRAAFRLGLDPSGVGSFARVVMRNGSSVLVLGDNGILRLAMQSGEFAFLEARPVFEKDTFALDYAQQILQHAPHAGEDGPGAIHGAYAVYLDRNGIRHMQFVSGREIKEGSDRMLISGMTAEEVCRKVALCALLAMAPIPLSELRHALDFETRSAAQ